MDSQTTSDYDINHEVNLMTELMDFSNLKQSQKNYLTIFYEYIDKINPCTFNNLLLSFIYGDMCAEHTDLFLISYYNLCNISSVSSPDYGNIYMMIYDAINYMESSKDINSRYSLLLKLLTNIKKINDTLKFSNFSSIMTKQIWKMQPFRKLFCEYETFDTGIEYANNGLFCSLMNSKSTDIEVNLYIDSLEPLLNDETIHDNLISYLFEILKVNHSYTYDNPISQHIYQKKCSSAYYNRFIMKFIFKLLKYYSFNTVIKNISDLGNVKISDYNIHECSSIYQKLYIISMYSIAIFHIPQIKAYYYYFSKIKSNQLLFFIDNLNFAKKSLDLSIKLLTEGDDHDNKIIQDLYISYLNNYKYIQSDDICNDIITYLDLVFDFNHNEIFYGDINSNIYMILLYFMHGANGILSNMHIRYDACNMLQKIVCKEGFSYFNKKEESSCFNESEKSEYDEIIISFLKYLTEVDFFKWSMLPESIIHYKQNIQLIIQLFDFSHESFKMIPESMMCNLIFTLINRSIYMYDQFINVCDVIANDLLISHNVKNIMSDILSIIVLTLSILTDMFQINIVVKSHSEIEHKLSTLLGILISASCDINHQIFTKLRSPHLASQITKKSYNILYSYLSLNNVSSESFSKIKNIITDNVSLSGLDNEQKLFIIKKLSEHKQIVYSNDFLDPITCEPIKEPVKIPGINEIFDRSTIVTCIYESGLNPYTREKMTIEELDEYNSNENIVKEITIFKQKMLDFVNMSNTN